MSINYLQPSNFQTDPKSLGPLVLVVAATNRIDMIDSALIRPGRFDKLIYLPPLEAEGRFELLQICAKTTPFSPDVNFEEIATKTEYYSGADLVNLCREVRTLFISDIILYYIHLYNLHNCACGYRSWVSNAL